MMPARQAPESRFALLFGEILHDVFLFKREESFYPDKSSAGCQKWNRMQSCLSVYGNDSFIFGPFVPLMHFLLLKCPPLLKRASFDEPPSSCASSLVSSCALLVLLVPPVSPAAFSLE